MVKAIFFDIDGTLIPIGQHKMPQDTIDALKQLKKKGIKIFIATGRAMNELNIITDTISFDGYITLNGQVCLNEDYEVFYGNPIPLKDLNVLVELFSEKKLPVVMVEKDKYYINLANFGNTVSSTIPIAIYEAKQEGLLQGNILLAGFGVGLSWGGTILKIQ